MTDRGNSAASRDITYHVHGYTNLDAMLAAESAHTPK